MLLSKSYLKRGRLNIHKKMFLNLRQRDMDVLLRATSPPVVSFCLRRISLTSMWNASSTKYRRAAEVSKNGQPIDCAKDWPSSVDTWMRLKENSDSMIHTLHYSTKTLPKKKRHTIICQWSYPPLMFPTDFAITMARGTNLSREPKTM